MLKNILLTLLSAICMTTPAWANETEETGHFRYTLEKKDIRVNADYSSETINEVSLKLLTAEAVRNNGRRTLSYNSNLEKIDILAAETRKADGRRIVVPASNMDRQNGSLGHIIQKDQQIITLTYPDLAPGDQVYIKYKHTNQPVFPGNYSISYSIAPNVIVEKFEAKVQLPANIALHIASKGFKQISDTTDNGLRTLAWSYSNLKVKNPPVAQADPLLNGPHLLITTFANWRAVGAAYSLRHRPQAEITPELRKLATELTQGANSEVEKTRRLYDWVRLNVRYDANYVGFGGWVPHRAHDVMINRYGDCKDHVVLFEALLRAVGIESSPALIQSNTSNFNLPKVPVSNYFNHILTYIPSQNIWLDSTSPHAPYGTIPASDRGRMVLLTYDAEKDETVRIPAVKPEHQHVVRTSRLHINPDLSGTRETTIWVGGELQAWYNAFRQSIGKGQENEWAKKNLLNRKTRGDATLMFLPPQDGRLGLKVTEKLDNYLSGQEFGLLPFNHAHAGPLNPQSPLDVFETSKRSSPFVCQALLVEDHVELTLPDNLRILRLPRDRNLNSGPLQLTVRNTQEGNLIVNDRVVRYDPGQTGTCTAEQWNAWRDDMRRARVMLGSNALAFENLDAQ